MRISFDRLSVGAAQEVVDTQTNKGTGSMPRQEDITNSGTASCWRFFALLLFCWSGSIEYLLSFQDTDNRLNSALSKTWSPFQPTVAATHEAS